MQPRKRNAVYRILYQRIVTGEYPCGSKLPGELKLIREFGVCRETLRGALALLKEDRLLRRAPGSGTHVRYCGNGNPPKLLFVIKNPSAASTVFKQYLESAGYSLLTVSRETFLAFSDDELEKYLAGNRITAIAYRGSLAFSDDALLKLQHSALPSLLFLASQNQLQRNRMAGVRYELKNAWGEALAILAEKGHHRIGIIAKRNHQGACHDFDRTFLDAVCRQFGIDTAPEYFANPVSAPELALAERGEYSPAVAGEVERMLALPQPPDAFLCHNDQWAVTVYEVLKRHKLRIPQDVAVMGFTGTIPQEHFEPKLTTFRFDAESLYGNLLRLLLHTDVWNKRGAERPVYEAKLHLCPGESV